MSIIVNNLTISTAALAGRYINSPEQRFIQGVTALPLQTSIDAHNKKADKETRIASVSRTIGKIVAGTLTGVTIRYLGICLINHFTKYRVEKDEFGAIKEVFPATKYDFMPHLKFDQSKMSLATFKNMHSNYVKFMGTFLATGIMIYTNFAVDAPLTRRIDQKVKPYVRRYFDKKEVEQSEVY